MKILVVGVDGGDKRIINAMNMPNLKAIMDRGVCLDVEEDLWSRGWAEILSGAHGRETGAFYSKPKLEGAHDFTQSFGVNAYENNRSITPLWARLSRLGHTVGFMNVPTTMPAPEVNGFFVSGAGGGSKASGVAHIPSAACFPLEVQDDLYRDNYILDTRFMTSGIRESGAFLNRLGEMHERRTEAFINLCRKYRPEFGFVAYRGIAVVTYLAMSEIEVLLEEPSSSLNEFQRGIAALHQDLDGCLANLLEELQPTYVVVVSDHGMVPRLWSINMNSWLRQIGLQKPFTAVRVAKSLTKQVARLAPRGIKRNIARAAPQVATSVAKPSVDWSRTRAFGARYVPGVYINDRERFGGPVTSENEIESMAQKIVDEFNATPEAAEYGLNARMYRSLYKHARYAALLPDVWIDHPDTFFFEGRGEFVESNKDYGPLVSLHSVDRDQYTGVKRRYPLLCVEREIADCIENSDPSDLTLAYRLIERAMVK